MPQAPQRSMSDRLRGLPQTGDYLAGAGFAVAVVGACMLLLTPLLYYVVPLVLGIVGLTLAILGMVRARRAGHGGFWLAVAATAIGAVAVVLGGVYAIVFHEALAGFGA